MNPAKIWLLVISLWLGLLPTGLRAQTNAPSIQDLMKSLQSSRSDAGATGETLFDPTGSRWALESPVDPATYRMVPGDRVLLGIWSQDPGTHALEVSPEGDLVVPRVGPIAVLGSTLEQAERTVQQELAAYYPRARISLTLMAPGRYRVFASGLVARPGAYEAQSGDRLHALLEAAGGIRAGGSLRRIRIRSIQAGSLAANAPVEADGAVELDYLRWLLAGNLDMNPVLQPGAIIEVPPRGPEVIVRGAVNGRDEVPPEARRESAAGNRPAEEPEYPIEWRENDTIGLAVEAAGGLSSQSSGMALLERAGGKVRVDLSDPSVLAQPVEAGDLLDVEYVPRWVYVVGSIRSPGRYPYYPGWSAEEYVMLAGGETETGRRSGWQISRIDGVSREIDGQVLIEPGTTLRVPETRTQKLSRYLAPITSATALVLSVIAIAGR